MRYNMVNSDNPYESSDEFLLKKGDSDFKSAIINLIHEQSSIFIYTISRYVSEILSNSKKFQEEIHNVSRVLSKINEISLKTRMLSINSSIEAARAGSAGKGFAVIAEEIGTLSDQTKACTDEVNRINSDLLNYSEADYRKLESSLQIFLESNNDVMVNINELVNISENGFIITTLAKRLEDHANFIRTLLNNTDSSAKLPDHHNCAFGKWYDANKERYRYMHGYDSIYETHKEFHDLAIEFNKTENIDVLLKFFLLSHELLAKFLLLTESFKNAIQKDSSYFDI